MSVAPQSANAPTVIHAQRIVSGQANTSTVLVHQVNVTEAHSILSSGGRISGRLAKSCSYFYDRSLKTESCCGCVSLRRAAFFWALVGLLILLSLSVTFVASDLIEKRRDAVVAIFLTGLLQIGSLAVILWALLDRNRFRLGLTMHKAARFKILFDLTQVVGLAYQSWQELDEHCDDTVSDKKKCQGQEFAWIMLGHSSVLLSNFYGDYIFLATAQYYRICQAILDRPNPIQDGNPVLVHVNPAAPLDNEPPPPQQQQQQQQQQPAQSQYLAAGDQQSAALKSVDEEQIAQLQQASQAAQS